MTISVVLLGTLAYLAIFTQIEAKPLFKWVGFGGMTALVFGDMMRLNRRFWGRLRFWFGILAALVAQCGLAILLLWNVPRVGTLVWALLLPLNYYAISYAISAYLALVLESRKDRLRD